jgi:hypothetical protein
MLVLGGEHMLSWEGGQVCFELTVRGRGCVKGW